MNNKWSLAKNPERCW